MDLFGGIMKELKPLMDASGVKADESMQLAIIQGEVFELENRKKEALAKIGQATYEMMKADLFEKEKLLPLCQNVDDADIQLGKKKEELKKAQKSADDKQREEEAKLAARRCPNCEEINDEGTRFCKFCGSKLGGVKPTENICSACGASNSPDARFCGGCGEPLEVNQLIEVKCPGCGEIYPAGTKFCSKCGTRL